MQLTRTEEGPSRPRGKGATTPVRRVKDQELAARGGRKKPEPHLEDIDIDDVGEQQPGTPAHEAAKDEDGEELGEREFMDEEDLVLEHFAEEEVKKKGKKQKLEGPSWTMCVFPPEEDSAEFPGGSKDTNVLTSYKTQFARYHRLTLVPVIHEKKMKQLAKIAPDAHAFAERWHADTSTFHMPSGEITVTLDDVSCRLHLPVTGLLLDHTPISKDQGEQVLTNLLGAEPADAHSEVAKTKGAHVTLTYLKGLFTDHLDQLAIFTFISVANTPKWRTITGYMTLLQAWIHAHFLGICGRIEVGKYDESQPAAMKYISTKGSTISTYRSMLDRTLGCDITWAPYSEHRGVRPLEDICFYSGWLKCGPTIVMYLPERIIQRACCYPSLARCAWIYIRWYFKISHPYMVPLPPGDPPMPCEQEVILEEEAEAEGPLATSLMGKINNMGWIAEDLLVSRELPEGSHAERDVKEILETAHYAR
ncbi:serine/threonine-protein phosphatase [Trifolium pratense]|uniref:Serine/threonine-protein phosphatase n=1 Tax=Trifolium pratense TaxID=57577 RepID=A0A2K3MPZ1_TRIPR|nr:serine/threonine-protein phosphatase [Trifolium pratense]